MDIVYFIYGLIFFITGVSAMVIALTHKTKYKFLNKLVYLGGYLLIKGIMEWEHLFLPIYFRELDIELYALHIGHRLIVAAGMFFMAIFAIELLNTIKDNFSFSRYIFAGISFLFFVYYFIYPGNYLIKDIVAWSVNVENAARHFMLLPGGLLATFILYQHAKDLPDTRKVQYSIKIFSFFIASYSILVGLFVYDINYTDHPSIFKRLTGIPLEIPETVLVFGMLIALYLLQQSLANAATLEKIKIREVVILDSERDRIARDLHDGTIQSLYGLSLRLAHTKHLINQGNNKEAEENISYVKASISNIINDIRNYIYDNLAQQYRYENLEEGINNILNEFKKTTDVQIDLVYIEKHPVEIPKDVIIHVYFIVKEAMLNILKHAMATKANVVIKITSQKIHITIQDNGVGFPKNSNSAGMGLVSIRKRVEYALHGTFKIYENKGILLDIEIPVRGLNDDKQKSVTS